MPANATWEKCRIMHWGRLFCDVELAADMTAYHHVPRRFIRPLDTMMNPKRLTRSSKKKRRTRSAGGHNCIDSNPCDALVSMSTRVCGVVTESVVEKKPRLAKVDSGVNDEVGGGTTSEKSGREEHNICVWFVEHRARVHVVS